MNIPIPCFIRISLVASEAPAIDASAGAHAHTWAWWALQLGTPLLIALGLPGNLLSLAVMKSARFRRKSYAHYLSTLAVFDALVLLAKLARWSAELGARPWLERGGDAACKGFNYVEHVSYLMSSWLVLCLSVERYCIQDTPQR